MDDFDINTDLENIHTDDDDDDDDDNINDSLDDTNLDILGENDVVQTNAIDVDKFEDAHQFEENWNVSNNNINSNNVNIDDYEDDLGNMDNGNGKNIDQYGTLDEAVSTTILRDLKMVGNKLKHVLIPTNIYSVELRDWDLWGPLLLCLSLATTLSFIPHVQADQMFTTVFLIISFGAVVVTLNALLLNGKISFLQSFCVLGYCIAPLNIAAIICLAIDSITGRFIVTFICYIWALRAAVVFVAQLVPENRKGLGIYPVLLFYASLAWMIVLRGAIDVEEAT